MTLTELQTFVGDYVDDPNFGYFTQATLTVKLNLALRGLHKLLLEANEDFYTLAVKTSLVAGQQHYSLPTDFQKVQLLEVVIGGSGVTADTQPVLPIARVEKYGFGSQQGTPQSYYLNEDLLMLHPVPDAVKELRMDYSRDVVLMETGSDEADAPVSYHEYIGLTVAYDCLIKDGRSVSSLDNKMKGFEKLLMSNMENRSQDYPRTFLRSELMGGGFDG